MLKVLVIPDVSRRYYTRDDLNPRVMRGTDRLKSVIDQFQTNLIDRGVKAREMQPKFENPARKARKHGARCSGHCKDSNSKASDSCTSSSDSSSSEEEDEVNLALMELERKKKHPSRLHPELWYNDSGEMNDGPLCRCSFKARRTGIRHGIYAGETSSAICQLNSNNADRLYHYRVTISPPTNFLLKRPTVIHYDEHEFIFEGFSLLSHYPLEKVPTCKVIRFNIEYTIVYIEEKVPDNFTVQELELFSRYLFVELLELVDLNLHAFGETKGCPQFHILPRFVRDLPENGKEMLSMNQVLLYLLRESQPVIDEMELGYLLKLPQVLFFFPLYFRDTVVLAACYRAFLYAGLLNGVLFAERVAKFSRSSERNDCDQAWSEAVLAPCGSVRPRSATTRCYQLVSSRTKISSCCSVILNISFSVPK